MEKYSEEKYSGNSYKTDLVGKRVDGNMVGEVYSEIRGNGIKCYD